MSKQEKTSKKTSETRTSSKTDPSATTPQGPSQSAASHPKAPSYISPTDLIAHIHESLKPLQALADKAGFPFLAYLIGMAVEESRSGRGKKS